MTERDVRDTAAGCMAPDLHFDRPETPERIKLHRRSYTEAPGRRVLHPGIEFDWSKTNVANLKKHSFGVQSDSSAEGVGDLMGTARTTELSGYLTAKAEDHYKSTKREPLGKPMARSYELPKRYSEPKFMFGKASERAVHESAEQLK